MRWPLQLLPSFLSPPARQMADVQVSPAQGLASCSHVPPQVCTCPFRRPLSSRGVALPGASKGHPHPCTPDSGSGSPAFPGRHLAFSGTVGRRNGPQAQKPPGAPPRQRPLRAPAQHSHVLCSASPWLARARVDRPDARGSCTSLAHSQAHPAPSPDPWHRSRQPRPGCSGRCPGSPTARPSPSPHLLHEPSPAGVVCPPNLWVSEWKPQAPVTHRGTSPTPPSPPAQHGALGPHHPRPPDAGPPACSPSPRCTHHPGVAPRPPSPFLRTPRAPAVCSACCRT